MGGQLELWRDDTWGGWRDRLRGRVRGWAARGVHFGTSSWKYAGWLGQIYTRERYLFQGRFATRLFEQGCLAEYAETFPTVCGDFSFYQFCRPDYWQELFAKVPATFKFGFKAPEQITAPRHSRHERYGAAVGQNNPDFLDADLFCREFLDRLAPYRRQVGYLVLEFPQFHRATQESNARFLDQLDAFLAKLPAGWPLGVEIRTKSLLGKEYFACLCRHGVAHIFNSWTQMPTIGEQWMLPGVLTANCVVARLLLRPGRTYEAAVKAFEPYDQVRDPYPEAYRDVADLVRHSCGRTPRREVFIAVNNRFVGNAPLAICEILDELDKPGDFDYTGGGGSSP